MTDDIRAGSLREALARIEGQRARERALSRLHDANPPMLFCRDPRHGSVCAADRCEGCRAQCDPAFWSEQRPTEKELSP